MMPSPGEGGIQPDLLAQQTELTVEHESNQRRSDMAVGVETRPKIEESYGKVQVSCRSSFAKQESKRVTAH